MIAVTATYDILFALHIAGALATLVVLITLRTNASGAASGSTSGEELRRRYPDRPNLAARVIHVMPLTGLIMALTGDSSVSLRQPWVGTGFALYLVAAFWLEARTLPVEREIARAVQSDASADVATTASRLGRQLDVVLTLVAVTLLVMIVQF